MASDIPLTLLGQGLTSKGISMPMSLGNCTILVPLARNFSLVTRGHFRRSFGKGSNVLDGHVALQGLELLVES